MAVHDLITFIEQSPTPWHAVETVKERLVKDGFQELFEEQAWHLERGAKYFVVRQGTSISAFIMPEKEAQKCYIAAAHTDSPGFKLKPHAEFRKENLIMLGLDIYGGPLLSSWLNRDLGIAGRVVYEQNNAFGQMLVRLDDAPILIPQLAIHLDRTINESGLILNKQEHLAAIAAVAPKESSEPFLDTILKRVCKYPILGADLFVYPLEKPRMIGFDGEMISGYRLDNLCSVQASLKAFLEDSSPSVDAVKMIVFWDHEEIGSSTMQGAGSTFLPQLMERIARSREHYFRMQNTSLCVSIDVGHAQHPNYADKHEPRHPALLNQGVLLKCSAQYRYASDAYSSALITHLCNQHGLNLQKVTNRGDIPSGSTIGPINACLTGVPTVDIGLAQLSMHSAKEVIGTQDHKDLIQLMTAFFKSV